MPLTDVYSAVEVGYMAMQCPEAEHYHVQAEDVLLEVLDELGRPCAPGETGRVVVTTLHNFVLPLIRYEILDYAEVGEPCPCGRSLPVLKRIVRRQRNLLTYPDGRRCWPVCHSTHWVGIGRIRQVQFLQRRPDALLVRLAADPLTAAQERQFVEVVRERLGYEFSVAFEYHTEIPRQPGGKYEDFMSELP